MSTILKNNYKCTLLTINISCQSELVYTDTIYSYTYYIDDVSTLNQLFIGITSLITYVYGIKTDKQFVKILEHNICNRGAIYKLISDKS